MPGIWYAKDREHARCAVAALEPTHRANSAKVFVKVVGDLDDPPVSEAKTT